MRILQENRRRLALTTLAGISSTLAFLTLILGVDIYAEVFPLPVKLTVVAIACVVFWPGALCGHEGGSRPSGRTAVPTAATTSPPPSRRI